MRKSLIITLLALLTICLFIACSSSPKEEEEVNSVKFVSTVSDDVIIKNEFVFKEDGSGTFKCYYGEELFSSETFTIDYTNGMKMSGNFSEPRWYKDYNENEPINSFDNLLTCNSIYNNCIAYTKVVE